MVVDSSCPRIACFLCGPRCCSSPTSQYIRSDWSLLAFCYQSCLYTFAWHKGLAWTALSLSFSVPLALGTTGWRSLNTHVQLQAAILFSHALFPLLAVLCMYLSLCPPTHLSKLDSQVVASGKAFLDITTVVTWGCFFPDLKNLQMFLTHGIEPVIVFLFTFQWYLIFSSGYYWCCLLWITHYMMMLKMATTFYWVTSVIDTLPGLRKHCSSQI